MIVGHTRGGPIASKAERREYARKMRANPTPDEAKFAHRMRQSGIIFEAQKSLGFYIADFFIRDRLLAIEIDGGYHDSECQAAKDKMRDLFLKKAGIKVIRIKNEDAESFDLSKIGRLPFRSPKDYASSFGKIGRAKDGVCRERGYKVSAREKRGIKKAFSLISADQITWDMVKSYRNVNPPGASRSTP